MKLIKWATEDGFDNGRNLFDYLCGRSTAV